MFKPYVARKQPAVDAHGAESRGNERRHGQQSAGQPAARIGIGEHRHQAQIWTAEKNRKRADQEASPGVEGHGGVFDGAVQQGHAVQVSDDGEDRAQAGSGRKGLGKVARFSEKANSKTLNPAMQKLNAVM